MKRSVLLIYTGGTIGMMEDLETRALKPFDFDHLFVEVPELKRFDLRLETYSFDPLIDSSNIQPRHWAEIARVIRDNYATYDGFVVLHGTDTMAFTASALSFMLRGLSKPVILTGSQLPIGMLRTDGKENLISAIQMAGMYRDNRARIAEVAVFFGSCLYRGNRTHKYSTEDFEAIHSPNLPPLAEVGIHIQFSKDLHSPEVEEQFSIQEEVEDRVAVLKLFPGITKTVVESVCNIPDLRGLIIETFGSGNATTESWFINVLNITRKRGVRVVNVTQCNKGFVEQGRYATSGAFQEMGIVPAVDMTLEAALTKMMVLLKQDLSEEAFERAMVTSIVGELTSYSSLV